MCHLSSTVYPNPLSNCTPLPQDNRGKDKNIVQKCNSMPKEKCPNCNVRLKCPFSLSIELHFCIIFLSFILYPTVKGGSRLRPQGTHFTSILEPDPKLISINLWTWFYPLATDSDYYNRHLHSFTFYRIDYLL